MSKVPHYPRMLQTLEELKFILKCFSMGENVGVIIVYRDDLHNHKLAGYIDPRSVYDTEGSRTHYVAKRDITKSDWKIILR